VWSRGVRIAGDGAGGASAAECLLVVSATAASGLRFAVYSPDADGGTADVFGATMDDVALDAERRRAGHLGTLDRFLADVFAGLKGGLVNKLYPPRVRLPGAAGGAGSARSGTRPAAGGDGDARYLSTVAPASARSPGGGGDCEVEVHYFRSTSEDKWVVFRCAPLLRAMPEQVFQDMWALHTGEPLSLSSVPICTPPPPCGQQAACVWRAQRGQVTSAPAWAMQMWMVGVRTAVPRRWGTAGVTWLQPMPQMTRRVHQVACQVAAPRVPVHVGTLQSK